MADKTTLKIIETLNSAASKLKEGIVQIKSVIPVNDEIDLHIWRIEKEIKLLHKAVLVEITKIDLNNEFQDIVDKLKGEIG